MTMTTLGTKEQGNAEIGLLVWRMWTRGLHIRKVVEHSKWGLAGPVSSHREDSAKGDLRYGAQLRKFQRRRILVSG